jgi:tight adherence protein C
MLICVESGMSIESAFNKVAQEVGRSPSNWPKNWADDGGAVLSARPPVAFQNLADRCGHSGVKAVLRALIQSENTAPPWGRLCA